jgi:propanediol utilization protein
MVAPWDALEAATERTPLKLELSNDTSKLTGAVTVTGPVNAEAVSVKLSEADGRFVKVENPLRTSGDTPKVACVAVSMLRVTAVVVLPAGFIAVIFIT